MPRLIVPPHEVAHGGDLGAALGRERGQIGVGGLRG